MFEENGEDTSLQMTNPNDMDENYAAVGKELKKLFIAQILLQAGIAALLIPGIVVVGICIMLAGYFVHITSLMNLSSIHPCYKNALYASKILIVCYTLNTLKIIPGLMIIAYPILNAALVYLICRASSDLLSEKGDHTLLKRGNLVFKLYLVGMAGQLIVWLQASVVFATKNATMLNIVRIEQMVLLIFMGVSGILFIIYLYKGSRILLL